MPTTRTERATVTYFLNTGPTPRHLAHDVRVFTRLRDAQAAAPSDRGWAIVRSEDRPYQPGRRSVVKASDDAYRAAAEHMCATINATVGGRA